MFKQNILVNGFVKKQKRVHILGFDMITFPAIISSALENSLSKGTEVAGIVRNFLAWGTKKGKVIWFLAHHFKGSSFQCKCGCSRYVLAIILESTVEGLDCWIINEWP